MTEALYKLHAWLSPGYPIGAYTYSHGLEWVIAAGVVTNRQSAQQYIWDALESGAARTDAILLAHAWRAEQDGDAVALDDLAALATGLATSAERLLETEAQGEAFAQVTADSWGGSGPAPYPIAVGRTAARHDVQLDDLLVVFCQAFVANLVSAAVRLIPLGQTDGQKIVADLMPDILALAKEAAKASLDDIGSCAIGADIASMRHETQDVRLFRS